MPKYIYWAKTKDSRTIKESIDASSREEVVSKLRSRGLFIISITDLSDKGDKINLPFLSRSRGKRSSIKIFDLVLLARNLSTTLSSGVTLLRSLEIIASQTESAKLESVLNSCKSSIRNGLSLSEAMSKYPDVFPPLWKGIVEVGEAAGNLQFVLDKLADYLEIRMDFERKVKSAMIYPGILAGAVTCAMIFFFKFILPKFVTLFKEFDMELPLMTRVIFDISIFFEKHFLLFLIFAAFFASAIFIMFKQKSIRAIWDKWSLRLFFLGNFIMVASLEKFCSTMAILLESGLPLVYSLEIVSRVMGNLLLEEKVLNAKDKVKEGSSLSDELRKTGIFPMLITEMTKIGEETGTLADVFKKVSKHYQRYMATVTERFLAAFEPLMIIVIGVAIGVVVVALFLPLFKLATVGGG